MPCRSTKELFITCMKYIRKISLKRCNNCDKEFECKDCDTRWVSHLSLELHYIEKHQKIMHECDICGYINIQAAVTRRHRRNVHEKVSENICHLCGISFTRPNLLKTHLAKNHDIGKAKHKCDFCKKIFSANFFLKEHMERVHLRNVKYDCDQCSHSSFSDVALKKHKRKVHQKKK